MRLVALKCFFLFSFVAAIVVLLFLIAMIILGFLTGLFWSGMEGPLLLGALVGCIWATREMFRAFTDVERDDSDPTVTRKIN